MTKVFKILLFLKSQSGILTKTIGAHLISSVRSTNVLIKDIRPAQFLPASDTDDLFVAQTK